MEIKLDSRGNYLVNFSYRPILVNRIKEIPGRSFDPRSKAWVIPATSREALDRFTRSVVHFEPVQWMDNVQERRVKEMDWFIPEMPELMVPHGLKIEPYPYQQQGIARGLEFKRFMNTDEPGLGKSEVLNSLISSPLGWLKMGNIRVGDSIFAKDGSIQNVTGVFPQGIVPTYRMTFNDGSFVDCNLDHLWSVRDQNRRRRGFGWTTKSTEEILNSGLVNKSNPKREASGRKPSLKWEIPMCEPVQFPTKQFIIPAYTMGALIGDGGLSNGSIQLSLPNAKLGIINNISNELDSEISVSSYPNGDLIKYSLVKNANRTNHNIENKYMGEIRRLKLDIVSGGKFIPAEYLQGDVEQRKALLAGLMDTDGSCIKNRTTFHTTSKQLTIDIKELIESLGGIVTIRPYDRTEEEKGIEYQVNVNTSFNPFFLKYKKELWTPNKMYKPTRYIESVEYVGKEEQQCIRVSSPDHLYLTNNYVVTHNTLQAIATINLAEAFPCLIVCPSSLKINWEREWNKFTDKKAMVLTDSVRDTWPFFWNTGLYQVFIVNYESLKKYFVQRIKESARFTLKDVVFRENINVFKSIIVDESHRCFPYDTKIMTNKGLIKIGEIVDKNLTNLLVRSVDLSTFIVSLKEIKTVWRNEIGQRKIYTIRHDKGELSATQDHKIYTSSGRYKEVCEIKSGDCLYLLRENISDSEDRENDSQMLLQKLRLKNGECTTRNQSIADIAKNEAGERIGLRMVWFNFICEIFSWKKILWKKLFGKVENGTAGSIGRKQNTRKQGENENTSYNPDAKSSVTKNAIRANEAKQSNGKPRNIGENDKKRSGENVSFSWWKWKTHRPSNNSLQCAKPTRKRNGAPNNSKESKGIFSICSIVLQGRYWNRKHKTCNRSRWIVPQNKEVEISRLEENRNIELVRVESCEIYESANIDRPTQCSGNSQIVYDLEIADNHNYFAEGILVSNCKSPSTQQSKFCKGIAAGKEYRILLTGTPVVNKPKDLVSQLSILGKLDEFGGYKDFVQRYCSGPNEASNLKELNAMLWQKAMFRREKSTVLKDLPDKVRQVLSCEITNRKEYKDAERDLIQYLIKYKEADDEKIMKAMKGEVMVRINILRQISARGKVKEVVEFVKDFQENGKKIILFCSLHEIVDQLKRAFPSAVSVTGREDQQQKQMSIDSFQRNPKTDIIICSIRAAGVGLTLTASSDVAFVEFPWTYADCCQCEDRSHRIGQKDSVTARYFLGKNTIDEKVYKIIQMKKGIANAVTGATDEIPENIIDMVANLFDVEIDEPDEID
jgi:intein/homing endonuclease